MTTPSTFIPPERTLMGPGPSDVSPRVLNAMCRSTLGRVNNCAGYSLTVTGR